MLFLTCTEHTSTMSPDLMKLRIMTINIKTKVLVKFGTSEMINQKAMKCVPFAVNVYAQDYDLVKLRIMDIKSS